MNKKSGLAKPIQYPPFADTNTWSFRHFSRYLCRPMLKLMKKLRDGSIAEVMQVVAHLDTPEVVLPSKKRRLNERI